MYLCNDTVTVYNRFTNDKKMKEYLPTVITGVHWFGTEKVTVTSDGLVSAKQHTIRIPINANFQGKQFVFPKDFQNASDRNNLFTLDEGDVIVRGVALEENPKPNILEEKYNEVVTVVSVTDNRNAPNAKHWKVVCK